MKNNERKHTPTPWKVLKCSDGWNVVDEANNFVAVTADSTYLEGKQDHANAAFIVRTVNSHEALLNFVKAELEAEKDTLRGTVLRSSPRLKELQALVAQAEEE